MNGLKKNSAFSLLEILITISLLAVLAVGLILIFNPAAQIVKANDLRRKHDLAQLKKALEDWYNDKGCYPRADQICFDSATNVCAPGNKTALSKTCHICGNDPNSPPFAPYLSKLPCDPKHPIQDYFYQVETPGCTRDPVACSGSTCPASYCPSWYRIYTKFENPSDSDSLALSCMGKGCGLKTTNPPYGYDYGVTNGKVLLEYSSEFSCLISGKCNGCGGNGNYYDCYNNPFCTDKSKIYSSGTACCTANPGGC